MSQTIADRHLLIYVHRQLFLVVLRGSAMVVAQLSMVFLGLVVFGFLAWGAYHALQAQEEREKRLKLAIKKRLRSAKNGLLGGSHDEFLIIAQVALLDTRRSDGRDVLKIIDQQGTLYCDLKGVHYVGLNRRLSWDWTKMLEIRSKYGSTTIMRIVVSNRQKISGFSLRVSYPIFVDILEFLRWGKDQSFTTKKSSKNGGDSSDVQTNITYNIVQNVQDSVIQGNIELHQP